MGMKNDQINHKGGIMGICIYDIIWFIYIYILLYSILYLIGLNSVKTITGLLQHPNTRSVFFTTWRGKITHCPALWVLHNQHRGGYPGVPGTSGVCAGTPPRLRRRPSSQRRGPKMRAIHEREKKVKRKSQQLPWYTAIVRSNVSTEPDVLHFGEAIG